MKKKHRLLKIILLCIGGLLVTTLALAGGFLIFASATTLQVKDKGKAADNCVHRHKAHIVAGQGIL